MINALYHKICEKSGEILLINALKWVKDDLIFDIQLDNGYFPPNGVLGIGFLEDLNWAKQSGG